MSNEAKQIADKVRGIAAEKRFTQDHVATILGLARSSVNARMNGGASFYAHELLTLAHAFGVDVSRFYPAPAPIVSSPEADTVGAGVTSVSGGAA